MQIEEFKETVLPADELEGTDIKLNPQFYIHTAIIKAQNSLDYVKEDPDKALMQFRFLIEHTETLAQSANLLSKDYDTELGNYIKSDEHKKNSDSRVKNFRLADKKLKLIMTEVFKNTLITAPLKA